MSPQLLPPLLRVEDLTVQFRGSRSAAVDHISFELLEGQRLGLIGESGSGKSITALACMGLLPWRARQSGSIRLRGTELAGLADKQFARLRGDDLTMIFQEPMTALDPTMAVGKQVAEVLRLHYRRQHLAGGSGETVDNARDRVVQILHEVGLAEAQRVADAYPHELSGGQRQRVLIAMALINRPDLVICDEPTTALDVTVQAKVLQLLDRELSGVGAACLFISHDLAVVSQVCSDLMVMYRGEIVERGSVLDVLGNPQHPYTRGLVATARIDLVPPGQRLPVIEDFFDAEAAR